MYRFIGCHIIDHQDNSFNFLIPLFENNGFYFRSISSKEKGQIISFQQLEIKDSQIKWMSLEHEEFNIGSPTVYAFRNKEEFFAGTREKLNIRLAEALRYGNLGSLERYDIYYFWGYEIGITESVCEFINEWPEGILFRQNFPIPKEIIVNPDEMAYLIYEIATILEYRSDTFKYEKLFVLKEDSKIKFLCYIVDIQKIKDRFQYLINKYESVFYKDLIVHCFFQCQIIDKSILDNLEFKFRNLIPLPSGNSNLELIEELIVRNIWKKKHNVFAILEALHQTEKDKGFASPQVKKIDTPLELKLLKRISQVKEKPYEKAIQ